MRDINEELKQIINSEKQQGVNGFKHAIYERFADANYTPGFEWDDSLDEAFQKLKELFDEATTKQEVIEIYLEIEKMLIEEISDFYL